MHNQDDFLAGIGESLQGGAHGGGIVCKAFGRRLCTYGGVCNSLCFPTPLVQLCAGKVIAIGCMPGTGRENDGRFGHGDRDDIGNHGSMQCNGI